MQPRPTSGDANGAYNIARKGILMAEHIRQWKHDGAIQQDLSLYISDREWDLWLTNQSEWKKMLPIFASRKQMNKNK